MSERIKVEFGPILARHIVRVLNRALETDPVAIRNLFEKRVVCSPELTDDPTIQVRDEDGIQTLGVLGLLNGIVGQNEKGQGFIAAIVECGCEDYRIVEFRVNDDNDNG